MAALYLGVDLLDHLCQAEIAFFHSNLGVEQYLQKQIAQLLAKSVHVVGVQGSQHFISLLQQGSPQ